jgi:hypothetical protein
MTVAYTRTFARKGSLRGRCLFNARYESISRFEPRRDAQGGPWQRSASHVPQVQRHDPLSSENVSHWELKGDPVLDR